MVPVMLFYLMPFFKQFRFITVFICLKLPLKNQVKMSITPAAPQCLVMDGDAGREAESELLTPQSEALTQKDEIPVPRQRFANPTSKNRNILTEA